MGKKREWIKMKRRRRKKNGTSSFAISVIDSEHFCGSAYQQVMESGIPFETVRSCINESPLTFAKHAAHKYTCHGTYEYMRALLDRRTLWPHALMKQIKKKYISRYCFLFWSYCSFLGCFFFFSHLDSNPSFHFGAPALPFEMTCILSTGALNNDINQWDKL